MKQHYVAHLAEGTRVDDLFVVRSRDLRAARTGDAYLSLQFADRTGAIGGVMFRPGPDDWALPVGSVALVRGTVTSYRGVRRISVESLKPSADFDRDDMIASGTRETSELLSALRLLIDGVRDPGLRDVLAEVFDDPRFFESFVTCPGATRCHHAYVGGLLEHTVSVASLCRSLAPRYDGLDADLLVAAALLHDVGRVEELRWETAVECTDAGRLLGHVVLGERIVSRAIDHAGSTLRAGTGMRLLHLVVSHHAEGEGGGPVRPATLEAVVLHHVDALDASAAGFVAAVAGAAVMEEPWSDSANQFGRPLYVPSSKDVSAGPALVHAGR